MTTYNQIIHSLFDKVLVLTLYSHFYLGLISSNDKLDIVSAEQYFQTATNLFSECPNKTSHVGAHKELSELYLQLGDIGKAERHIQNALQIRNGDTDTYNKQIQLGRIYAIYGSILRANKAYNASIDTLKKAITIFENYESNPNVQKELAAVHNKLANTYEILQRYPEALANYESAMSYSSQFNLLNLNNIGVVNLYMNRNDEALRYFQKAQEYAKSPLEIASVADNLGDYYVQQLEFQNALEQYQLAITNISPSFDSTNIYINPTIANLQETIFKTDLLTFLSDKANCWLTYAENQPESAQQYQTYALQTYQTIDTLIDLIRQSYSQEQSKLFWRKEVKPIYEEALETAFLLEDDAAIFHFMERSKAILLLEQMQLNDYINRDNTPQRTTILALRSEINRTRQELEKQFNQQTFRQLHSLEAEFAELIDSSYQEFDNTIQTITLTEAQKLLSRKTILINYFYGKDHIYAFALNSKGSTKRKRIPLTSIWKKRLNETIPLFSTTIEDTKIYQEYTNGLYEDLYASLLGDWWSSMQQAIILPDDVLSFIPFEALSTQKEDWRSFLIKEKETRYAYSATTLQQTQSTRTKKTQLLAVLPFVEESINFRSPPSRKQYLPNLKKSSDSLQDILQKYFEQKYLVQKDAIRDSLKLYLAETTLLHLHTHAVIDSIGVPYIHLYRDSLSLIDVSTLDAPNLDLVVLSACESSLGEIKEGEGVYSLANHFLQSANSAIASLWKVDEDQSIAIFSPFYENLAAGTTKAKSLHQAKLTYLQNHEGDDRKLSPHRWASFIFIGGDYPTSTNVYYWLGLAGLSLLLFFFWKKRKKES